MKFYTSRGSYYSLTPRGYLAYWLGNPELRDLQPAIIAQTMAGTYNAETLERLPDDVEPCDVKGLRVYFTI